MWHFDDTYTSSESSAIHRTAEFPIVCLLVKNFNGFQICRSVEPANSIELTIDHGQANLKVDVVCEVNPECPEAKERPRGQREANKEHSPHFV